MKKYLPTCYKNSKEVEKLSVTPCLKRKGHQGKHEHFELCKSNSCSCAGRNKPPRKQTWDMWALINQDGGNNYAYTLKSDAIYDKKSIGNAMGERFKIKKVLVIEK